MTLKSRLRIGFAGLALAASALVSLPAFANGGEFFEEYAAALSKPNPNMGAPFFGFVRDTHGKAIPHAMVTATFGGADENLTILADAVGHYRLPGFDKSIDASKVEIGCSKLGYRLATREKRVQKGAPNAPIEVDCKMTQLDGREQS
jgi:hypothetical protein